MRFMIIDDDEAIRSMLQELIEDYDLGEVVDSLPGAAALDNKLLRLHKIDILIIDMLMPERDGVQAVKDIKQNFHGKIIMLSQVEDKELVGNAYTLGVDYYITKPLNRNEVVSVIRSVSEHISLKNLVHNIEDNLQTVLRPVEARITAEKPLSIGERGESILSTLGISGDAACRDLLDILRYLDTHTDVDSMPPLTLKTLFLALADHRHSPDAQKEAKAIEQRLRRTIFQALVNLASIGIVDYTNPKFEEYAPRYFDFAEVRSIMRMLENEEKPQISQVHINTKKFIRTLFIDTKK